MDTGCIISSRNQISNNSRLEAIWKEEQTYPQWFCQSVPEIWRGTFDKFLEACQTSEIYEKDGTFVFVEPTNEIHFSVMRGTKPDIEWLRELRKQLPPFIFGWINKRNRQMIAVAQELGFVFEGLRMFHGESHGKVVEWWCFKSLREA